MNSEFLHGLKECVKELNKKGFGLEHIIAGDRTG